MLREQLAKIYEKLSPPAKARKKFLDEFPDKVLLRRMVNGEQDPTSRVLFKYLEKGFYDIPGFIGLSLFGSRALGYGQKSRNTISDYDIFLLVDQEEDTPDARKDFWSDVLERLPAETEVAYRSRLLTQSRLRTKLAEHTFKLDFVLINLNFGRLSQMTDSESQIQLAACLRALFSPAREHIPPGQHSRVKIHREEIAREFQKILQGDINKANEFLNTMSIHIANLETDYYYQASGVYKPGANKILDRYRLDPNSYQQLHEARRKLWLSYLRKCLYRQNSKPKSGS